MEYSWIVIFRLGHLTDFEERWGVPTLCDAVIYEPISFILFLLESHTSHTSMYAKPGDEPGFISSSPTSH